MCEFFSFCGIDGKYLYFNAEQRQKILKDEGEFRGLEYNPDSHTSIAHFYGYRGRKEDTLRKYEYNPLSRTIYFRSDGADRAEADRVREWVKSLDFRTIVPYLIIKPIISPYDIEPPKVTEKHIAMLKRWRSSIKYSITDLIEDSIWDTVWEAVWTSVGKGDVSYVGDSVQAYVSSFFDVWGGKNPYQDCIDLWEMGLVPAYDWKKWYILSKNGVEWVED